MSFLHLFKESKEVIEPYAISLLLSKSNDIQYIQFNEQNKNDHGVDFIFYDEDFPLGAGVDVKAQSPKKRELDTAFIEVIDCYGKKSLSESPADYYMILRNYNQYEHNCDEWYLIPRVCLIWLINENDYEYIASRDSDNGKPCYGYKVKYLDIKEMSELYEVLVK